MKEKQASFATRILYHTNMVINACIMDGPIRSNSLAAPLLSTEGRSMKAKNANFAIWILYKHEHQFQPYTDQKDDNINRSKRIRMVSHDKGRQNGTVVGLRPRNDQD